MKNENGEITFKSFFKWLRSDSGKKYSFFIFYFFFFIFIFVILSFTNDDSISTEQKENIKEEVESSLPFSLKKLETTDYNFTYTVLKNDWEKEYLGKKEGNIVSISDDTGIYSFQYKNGNLIPNNSLEEYYQLFDIYELKRMIKMSKYEYKQEYSDGTITYAYLITNGNLASFLNIENINSKEMENEILIKTNINNEVVSFTFDVLNLMNSANTLDNKDTLYKIIVTYGDIDE